MEQNPQQQQPASIQAFQYLGDLIAEYLQTLPPAVRGPVVGTVNECSRTVHAKLMEAERPAQPTAEPPAE